MAPRSGTQTSRAWGLTVAALKRLPSASGHLAGRDPKIDRACPEAALFPVWHDAKVHAPVAATGLDGNGVWSCNRPSTSWPGAGARPRPRAPSAGASARGAR